MKAKLQAFLLSLLSRKLILTIAGGALLIQNKQYGEAVVLMLGYLGVEGGADIVSRVKTGTLTAQYIEKAVSQNIDGDDNAVDTTKIVTGRTPMFDELPENQDK